MKPNGLVAAASMTSQTLTPSLSQTMAISFTSPILTLRKVFSRSFDQLRRFGSGHRNQGIDGRLVQRQCHRLAVGA